MPSCPPNFKFGTDTHGFGLILGVIVFFGVGDKAFPTDMGIYGAGGALVKSPYSRPGVGGSMVYFSVEDCAIDESRVSAAGGKVLRPKFSIGEFGWVTLCEDTEGNHFGLSSMK